MPSYEVEVHTWVRVDIEPGSDAITRATDPEHPFYSDFEIHTEDEMVKALAINEVNLSVGDASRLDGWGDLPRGEVQMRVLYMSTEAESVRKMSESERG